jgi:hypothetical protein
VLPPSAATKAGVTSASASGRNPAQSEQTGRFNPQPPRAPRDAATPARSAIREPSPLDDARDELETHRPAPLATQEKRLPQTFIAPPETSRANVLSNAAALVSVLSVVGILWLVMR